MRCAVLPCLGLGDGLITSVLSENLYRSGHTVTTYHPILWKMAPLLPHHALQARPEDPSELAAYDKIFLFYEKLTWMERVRNYAEEHFPEKLTVLNPIATPNRDYPFWEQGGFDGTKPFVDNLATFCKDKLGMAEPTRSNGLTLPEGITPGKYPKRVILHPTSSRPGKNWSQQKFLCLAQRLEHKGFEPIFILTKEEQLDWRGVNVPLFEDLCELTHFIAESGAMIGNDSGIGHLASSVGLPTLTICRSSLSADFWRPAWQEGRVIVPPGWIPNVKGLRLRDKKWQHFVPVSKVLREFDGLLSRK
jgi:heptosyltransferase III